MRMLIFLLLGVALMCHAADLPSAVVPNGLGVNIHFTGAPVRDLDGIQAAGFRFVRMDFAWEAVERTQGVYTFDAYDTLLAALQARNIRPIFILDYSNKLYEPIRSVVTEEGRQAFARFASAAGTHFRGKGIIWELWNEPNYAGFWQPAPDADAYVRLAKVALPALRKADPAATIIAPASANIDMTFLEACFKAGLLSLVDAVSIHPYRQTSPESAAAEIAHLRVRIARYAPDRPNLPVIASEWGYSTVWKGYDDARQGQYLPREFLCNLAAGIPLSIWYDWHDDGVSATDPECNFGTVKNDYTPKPAYPAMQRLTKALTGMHFVKRLSSAPDDYLLLFTDGTRFTLAAWTTGVAHPATPCPGADVTLTGDPQYLPVPDTAHDVLAEGAWTLKPASPAVASSSTAKGLLPGFTVKVHNHFAKAVPVEIALSKPVNTTGKLAGAAIFTLKPGETVTRVWTGTRPPRRDKDVAVTVSVSVDGVKGEQVVPFPLTDPVVLRAVAMGPNRIGAYFAFPAGEVFDGWLEPFGIVKHLPVYPHVKVETTGEATASYQGTPLTLYPADHGYILRTPDDMQPVVFTLKENGVVVADTGLFHLTPLDVTTKTAVAVNDGDLKVPATFTLEDVTEDKDAPVETAVRFTYDYAAGWKFVRIAPPTQLPIAGKPHALGVWVKGNTSHCVLITRFVDASGRMYQALYGSLDFTGWRFLTAPLDDPTVYHWGGNPDTPGITYPIQLNTYVLIDDNRTAVKGTVEFAGFQLLY